MRTRILLPYQLKMVKMKKDSVKLPFNQEGIFSLGQKE